LLGPRKDQALCTLAPGVQTRIGVSPSGDSGLRFEFDAAGKHHSAAPDYFFESSPLQSINASVASEYSVKVNGSTKPDQTLKAHT